MTTFVSKLKKLKMFILLRGTRRTADSLHPLAVDLLRKSQSLEQVVMMDFSQSIGLDGENEDDEPIWSFLLSRGSDEMQGLSWHDESPQQFLLPLRMEDTLR